MKHDPLATIPEEFVNWHTKALFEGRVLESDPALVLHLIPRGMGMRDYVVRHLDGKMTVSFELFSLQDPTHTRLHTIRVTTEQ